MYFKRVSSDFSGVLTIILVPFVSCLLESALLFFVPDPLAPNAPVAIFDLAVSCRIRF